MKDFLQHHNADLCVTCTLPESSHFLTLLGILKRLCTAAVLCEAVFWGLENHCWVNVDCSQSEIHQQVLKSVPERREAILLLPQIPNLAGSVRWSIIYTVECCNHYCGCSADLLCFFYTHHGKFPLLIDFACHRGLGIRGILVNVFKCGFLNSYFGIPLCCLIPDAPRTWTFSRTWRLRRFKVAEVI